MSVNIAYMDPMVIGTSVSPMVCSQSIESIGPSLWLKLQYPSRTPWYIVLCGAEMTKHLRLEEELQKMSTGPVKFLSVLLSEPVLLWNKNWPPNFSCLEEYQVKSWLAKKLSLPPSCPFRVFPRKAKCDSYRTANKSRPNRGVIWNK